MCRSIIFTKVNITIKIFIKKIYIFGKALVRYVATNSQSSYKNEHAKVT